MANAFKQLVEEAMLSEEISQYDTALASVDLDTLDQLEKQVYSDMVKQNGKVAALKIIVNSVEGDLDQLSPELQHVARTYSDWAE